MSFRCNEVNTNFPNVHFLNNQFHEDDLKLFIDINLLLIGLIMCIVTMTRPDL